MTGLVLILVTKANSKDKLDNPDKWNIANGYELTFSNLLALYMPANYKLEVIITQVWASLVFLLFPDDSTKDIMGSVHVYVSIFQNACLYGGKRYRIYRILRSMFSWHGHACFLRFFQGLAVTVTAFVLVMSSTNAIDTILNFASIKFISTLDETAFEMAQKRWFGKRLCQDAKDIDVCNKGFVFKQNGSMHEVSSSRDHFTLPNGDTLRIENRDGQWGFFMGTAQLSPDELALRGITTETIDVNPGFTSYWVTFGVMAILFCCAFVPVHVFQNSVDKWTTKVLRVEFGESRLKEFNGFYKTNGTRNKKRRFVYERSNDNDTNLAFTTQPPQLHFSDDNAWVFFSGDETPLARSSKTTSFDISSSFDGVWYAPFANRPQTVDISASELLRVKFKGGSSENLTNHSGCYERSAKKYNRNPFYTKYKVHNGTIPSLSYCATNQIWVLLRDFADPCKPGDKELAHSSASQSSDISSASELSWFLPDNEAITVDFEEKADNPEILLCDAEINDGRCDAHLNKFEYNWDGGDCCATTCAHDLCGEEMVMFGAKSFGFPNCSNEEMENLTISLDAFEQREVDASKFNGIDNSTWNDFWCLTDTTLELECDGKLVFSVRINSSMKGQVEKALVRTGSVCQLTVTTFEPLGSINISISGIPASNTSIAPWNVLPDTVRNLTGLSMLSLSNNDLQGSIPTEIGRIGNSLSIFRLNDNSLTGVIPTETGMLLGLSTLDLENNHLEGVIPREIGMIRNLTAIYLRNNILDGSIPTEIGQFEDLLYLDLSNNRLTGAIPTEIGKLTSLKYLDLSGNDLSGSIPDQQLQNLTKLVVLRVLEVGNERLTGSIDCTKLPLLSNATICATFASDFYENLQYYDSEEAMALGTSSEMLPSVEVTSDPPIEVPPPEPPLSLPPDRRNSGGVLPLGVGD